MAVFIADSLPIDQHYVQNPNELFEKPADDLIVDLESNIILEAHLQCAGQEMPLSTADADYFGPLMVDICETRLSKDKEGWCVFCSVLALLIFSFDLQGITRIPNSYLSQQSMLP